MLAVSLHPTPRPRLVKESCLVPIVDWKSGRVQIQTWLKWSKRDRYMTLVRIPAGHPVRICFSIGNSNFIKQVAWPSEFRPLRDWPSDYIRAIAGWWDAPGWARNEPGGLLVDEPMLFLGKRLPDSCIRWTKDLRLLHRRKSPRHRISNQRDDE